MNESSFRGIRLLFVASVLLTILLLGFWFGNYLLRRRRHTDEPRRRFPFLTGCLMLLGAVWSLRMAVGFYLLSKSGAFSWDAGLEAMLASAVEALQTFSMDANYEDSVQYGKEMIEAVYAGSRHLAALKTFFGIYCSVLNVAAPVTGGAIVFDILTSFFPGLRLFLGALNPFFRLYLFSGLNDRSFALAKSILSEADSRGVIVFAGTDPRREDQSDDMYADLAESAARLNAICIKTDLTHLRLRILGKRTFFLMDENELNNMKTLVAKVQNDRKKMLRGADVYLFADNAVYDRVKDDIEHTLEQHGYRPRSDERCDMPIILPVNGYQNLVHHLLVNVPLFEPLLPEREAYGKESVLRVTILGTGSIGTEMLLDTIWCGQMLNCRLELHVVSCEPKKEFIRKLNALNPELLQSMEQGSPILRINDAGSFAPPYGSLTYHKADLGSGDLKTLFGKCPELLDTHYFVTALGSDDLNIKLSEVLRHEIGQHHLQCMQQRKEAAAQGRPIPCPAPRTVIAYAVYEPKLCKALNQNALQSCGCKHSNDLYLYAFGSLEAEYSVGNIMMPELSAGNCELRNSYLYRANDPARRSLGRDRLNYYTLWSKVARMTHTKYKMYSAGLRLPSVFQPKQEKKWARIFAAFRQLCIDRNQISEKQLSALAEYKDVFLPGALPQTTDAWLAWQHADAWLEHRRWNAFIRSSGYRHTDQYPLYIGRTDDHKSLGLMLHPCLVECDMRGIHPDLQAEIAACSASPAQLAEFDLLDRLTYHLRYELGHLKYDFKKYDYTSKNIENLERYFRYTILHEDPPKESQLKMHINRLRRRLMPFIMKLRKLLPHRKEYRMKKETEFRARAKALVAGMTRDEKLGLLTTHQFPVKRLGLDEFFIGTEVARGFVGRDAEHFSTVTPQPVGMAASFDRDLIRQLGSIAGDECRAYHNSGDKGALCVWGPTVDMERDPRWGRTEEAYGEDVLLAGEMSAAYTQGLAGDDDTYMKTIPTLKHFCANNHEEQRVSGNSQLPPRLKYEYYYAAFMPAIRYGGARSVMTAYNEINGLPAMLNPELDSILKAQWGMWFAVTDGADFQQTVLSHRYCPTHAEAYAEAVKAGCSIMTDEAELTRKSAEIALRDGLLTEADIDRVLEEVMYARLRLGQLDPDCPYHKLTADCIDSDASRAVNLQMAKEQIVLLKNDGLLPLRPASAPKKLAVLGPLADENLMDWYTGEFRDAVSPLAGIRAAYPNSEIISDPLWDLVAVQAPNGKYLCAHADGSVVADADNISDDAVFELQDWGENWQNLYSPKYARYVRLGDDGRLHLHNRRIYDWFTRETFNLHDTPDGTLLEDFQFHRRLCLQPDGTLHFTERRTVLPDVLFRIEPVSRGAERGTQLAKEAGAVIYCTGNHPVQVAKECYDRKTLALNIQPDMALRLHELNKNTILLLISSYPYAVCREQETLPAILWSTHAGAHLGTAVAAVLSGDYSPAGRLPMTWYRSEHDLPPLDDYDIASAGSTYMYFKGKPLYPFGHGCSYAQFAYRDLSVSACKNGDLAAEVTVQNVSDTDSDEVVQVYFDMPESAVPRPAKKLCGFARVHLKAGEEKTISVAIPAYILQIYDTHSARMITESGVYRFCAGGSSAELPVCAALELAGEQISDRGSSIPAESFDGAHSIEIRWSREKRCHYLRAHGWAGTAVYAGVPLEDAKALKLSVVSPIKPCELTVQVCGESLQLPVQTSNSTDDFAEYTLPLPAGLPKHGIVIVTLPEAVQLGGIAVSDT